MKGLDAVDYVVLFILFVLLNSSVVKHIDLAADRVAQACGGKVEPTR